eukprot:TRINITY_DN18543_c0_g1_i2.p1 TRINITY_DN18543_c0_g1~~TRINITY_DN18543_c0_g1_i2.p1  ORF type:complete len:312 (-),score=36.33 TRINITY_DN18543_c0_g1_i2:114-1049(-)
MASNRNIISQSMNLSAFCRMQNMLHSNLTPCALLIAASSLVLFEHVKREGAFTHYLSMNVLTMLPLAILESKILVCTNPVSFISKASGNVLLLHVFFLILRFPGHITDGIFDISFFFDVGSLIAACIILRLCFGLRPNYGTLYQYREALLIALCALATAVLTEGFNAYLRRQHFDQAHLLPTQRYLLVVLLAVAEMGAFYSELLSFMPAVWIVCLPSKSATGPSEEQYEVGGTQQRVAYLLAFLVCFYLIEDSVAAVVTGWAFPLVAPVHVIHFLLVLDFACFLLANLYDPAKLGRLMGSIAYALSDIYSV